MHITDHHQSSSLPQQGKQPPPFFFLEVSSSLMSSFVASASATASSLEISASASASSLEISASAFASSLEISAVSAPWASALSFGCSAFDASSWVAGASLGFVDSGPSVAVCDLVLYLLVGCTSSPSSDLEDSGSGALSSCSILGGSVPSVPSSFWALFS